MLPSELSIEDRRLFWRNYDKWCVMFSAPEVDEQLAKLSVTSIVEERLVPRKDWAGRPINGRPYGIGRPDRRLLASNTYRHHRFVNEAGWERTERVPCDVYMVPVQYQSTKHTDMITPIMMARYPWLAEFKCRFYSLNFYPDHVEEFYVGVGADVAGHHTLYVPYAAFMARDVAAIEKRNEDYLRWYSKKKDVWGTMKNLPEVLRFFDRMLAGATP